MGRLARRSGRVLALALAAATPLWAVPATAAPDGATEASTTLTRTAWASVDSGLPNAPYYNGTGEARSGTWDGGAHKVRSFFLFNTKSIKGKKVTKATLTIRLVHSWSCTASPVDLMSISGYLGPKTTWNHPPLMGAKLDTKTVAKGFNGTCPAGPVQFNVTSWAQAASASKWDAAGVGLKAPNEKLNQQWKRWSNNPTVQVTY